MGGDFPDPVVDIAIEPKDKADYGKLSLALGHIAMSDASFRFDTDEESRQTIISGSGELHLDSIVERLRTEFGIGLGTLVLAVNVVLLASYTLGCHSIRHLAGGLKDEVSKSPMRHACYNCSSALNGRHMMFAWMSLFSVALSDVYVSLCSMGVTTDVRLI